MRLDHLLAATALGAPLDLAQEAKAAAVLEAFGFVVAGGAFVLDDPFPWMTVTPQDGTLHVHVSTPVPTHLVSRLTAALEGLAREAGLARIDLLTRRAIEPGEWAARLSQLAADAPPRRF